MAESKLNPREKARLEEEKKNKKMRTRYILVGAVVVILAALVIVVNSRAFTNRFPALWVGDTKYSLADVNYEYQSAYMQMAQTYGAYGLIDTNTPLDEQPCLFDPDGGTWHDYFKDYAENNLVQKTALSDAATAAGYTQLTDDEAAQIDSAIASYQLSAATYGYTLDGYLTANYGAGNSEETVRANMARELLISRYMEDLYNSYSYTDAEKDAYYEEHTQDLNTVNYVYAFISGAADEEAGLDEDAAMAAAAETARTIAADSDGQEDLFRAAVLTATGSEAAESSYSVSSFLSNFEGDVTEEELVYGTVFTHEGSGGWYAVYVLGLEDNHYNTVSVRHILIQTVDEDGDGVYSDEEKQAAYDAVAAIQEEWLAGEATEESFAALADEKSEDDGSNTNGGLYEGIYKGQMVEEFDEFCFAEHEHGDTAIVYGESSSYAGYHLVYFVGADGDLYSRTLAENEMRSEDYNDTVAAQLEPYSSRHGFMWRYVMNTNT